MALLVSLQQSGGREDLGVVIPLVEHAEKSEARLSIEDDVLALSQKFLVIETMVGHETKNRETVCSENLERAVHTASALPHVRRDQFLRD